MCFVQVFPRVSNDTVVVVLIDLFYGFNVVAM